MLVRLAMMLCRWSPTLRRLLWRTWYQRLAFQGAAGTWTFMNYGCALRPDKILPLASSDEPDRYSIQLYARVVEPIAIAGQRVLEVGCGRGGGASYLARYHHPSELIAIDFSDAAIEVCRRRHTAVANLVFAVGDAEQLPFAAESFDVVVNVESSHCYGNVESFFREVVRVLRPGGWFLFADARPKKKLPELATSLAATEGWHLTETEDLTQDVIAALTVEDERKRRLIGEVFPPNRRKIIEEFAALTGTTMHRGFRENIISYQRWSFRKHAADRL